jgi:hypothetical protein
MGVGVLIQEHLRDWGNAATNLPLWAKNASIAGAAMLKVGWRTETRMMPKQGGIEKRRSITMADGSRRSILLQEMEEQVIRETLDIHAQAPGTWGVDPESASAADAVWGWYEDYVPASEIIRQAKSGYFDLVKPSDLEYLLDSNKDYTNDKILFFRHLFDGDTFHHYFGQAAKDSMDRVSLRTFYTKEMRMYAVDGKLLKIEANPFSFLRDGFPFEILTANHTGNIIGVSDLYSLKPYLFEYNKLRNSELYNAELAADQGWFTTETDPERLDAFRYRRPGSTIPVPDVERTYLPIPYNPISPETRNTRIGILQDLYLIAGINESSLGATPAPNIRSADQQAQLQQLSSGRRTGSNLTTESCMRSAGSKFLAMYRRFMSETQVVELFGDYSGSFASISAQHLGAVHDLELVSLKEEEARKAAHAGELIQLFPLIVQMPEFDAVKFMKDVIRSFGYNAERYSNPGVGPTIPGQTGAPAASAPGPAGPALTPPFPSTPLGGLGSAQGGLPSEVPPTVN